MTYFLQILISGLVIGCIYGMAALGFTIVFNATRVINFAVANLGFIGAGAVVLPGRHIGAGAVVGAGSVVIHDVPEGVTVAGNPAREIKRS